MSDDPHGQGEMPPWLQPVLEQEEEGGFQSDKVKKIAAIVAVAVLAGFVIVLGVMYFSGDNQDRGPVVVGPQEGPVREKPADPGGMKVEGREMEVYDVVSGEKDDNSQRIGEVAEAPVTEIPEEQRQALDDTIKDIEGQAGEAAKEKPAAVEAETPAPAKEQAPTRDEVVSNVNNAVEEARKKEEPAVNSAKSKPVQKTDEPPRLVKTAIPASAFKVQLGAFSKRSTADATWKSAKTKFRSYLGNLTPIVDEIPRSSGAVLHRLRAGPVANRTEADRICLALKAAGQACMVVKPE